MQRILYVEDDPDIQEIARIALEMVGGYTVEIVSSGAVALQRLPVFRPDVVLLDVMMPEMDGPTTLVNLRKLPEGAPLPVVFMTAKVQPQEAQRYLDLGAVGVIAKPFDPMTLAGEVKAYWERARAAA